MKQTTLVFVIALLITVAARGADQPNIVFAFADDLGKYASAYADSNLPSPNDIIRTPNFDRVAREGTLFQNALVSAPSCTPSRAAIVSCRHFFRNGSHSQLHHPWMKGFDDPWDEVKGFPLILQDAGYHIGWSYKMHISEDRMGGKQRNYRAAGSRFNSFSQNAMKAGDPQAEKTKLLAEVHDNFNAFLDDRKDNQPFYYWFNPTNTHRSWIQGSGKKLWGIDPDDLKGKLPKFLPDNEIIREDFADYLGETMAFDAAVGVLLEELAERGELDNTIIVVSGDHGAPGFPRGKCNLYDFGTQVPLAIRWPGQIAAGRSIATPVSLIDLGPTFLDAAGLKPTPDMNGQSLLPVIRNDAPAGEDALRGYAIVGRENHVNEARPGGLPYPMRAIRTREYLYIVNFAPDRWPVAQPPLSARLIKTVKGSRSSRRMDMDGGPTLDFFTEYEGSQSIATEWSLGFGLRPAEELYAVTVDPDQTQNLATNVDFTEIRQRLRAQLFEELTAGKDPRVMGDGSAFDQPPYAPTDPERGVIEKD
ncbi:MAG: sulfatase [Planctomycetaceae bacterium]